MQPEDDPQLNLDNFRQHLGLPPLPVVQNTKPWNLTVLKARKNLCIPPAFAFLLISKYYKSLGKTKIKLLLSKQIKKTPFRDVLLEPEHEPFIKILANRIKRYSIKYPDHTIIGKAIPKSQLKLFKTIFSSYKHLQHLNLIRYQIPHKSFLASIAKVNQLESLHLRLLIDKNSIYPNFFNNLKQLKHLALFITQSSKDPVDLNAFERFLLGFTLLPSLQSYNIDCYGLNNTFQQGDDFLEILLYCLNQSKAPKFKVEISYRKDYIPLRTDRFPSFFQSLDTFVYKYALSVHLIKFCPKVNATRTLIIILHFSLTEVSPENLLNACTSLKNALIEFRSDSIPLIDLKFPQTLKLLTLYARDKPSQEFTPQALEKWTLAISPLKNLEEFCLGFNTSSIDSIQWINQVSQLEAMKSLKNYSLEFTPLFNRGPGLKNADLNSFLSEWSRNIQKLSHLGSFSLSLQNISLHSLEFLTNAISSLSNLRNLRIILKQSPPNEKLEFSIPWHKVSMLENVEIQLLEFNFKDEFEVHLLKDLDSAHFENLKRLFIFGPKFNETITIPLLSKFKNSKGFSVVADNQRVQITKSI